MGWLPTSEQVVIAESLSALDQLRTPDPDTATEIFLPGDAVTGTPPEWDNHDFHLSIGFGFPTWRDGHIHVTKRPGGYLAHRDTYHPYREWWHHLTRDTTPRQKLVLATLAASAYRSLRTRQMPSHVRRLCATLTGSLF